MWEIRQEIDLETSVKISPFCYNWQSVCWFMLKGLDLWRFLVWDRSATYLVILTIFLIGLSYMAFKSFKRRWNEVPMSEIQSLRDRVQFVSQDMVMLQDALNAAIGPQLLETNSEEVVNNVIGALYESETKKERDSSPGPKDRETIVEPTSADQENNEPDPEIPEPEIPLPKPQEVPLVKHRVHFEENSLVTQPCVLKKPIIKPKPKRKISKNTHDLKDNLDVPRAFNQSNMRKRAIMSVPTPGWKI
ncbi:uncharacterized protein LOC119555251 [Drosophila subpulchrella]|uniref:uncharacterized protein LOC119555251 n=1 Tax=Drosophila subpulchrella TaxID=1486046 RepID=UPI0018A12FA7|nr:uncharacterized protein LOC119555251 [Drosophila subpulchrella]